MSSHSHCQSVAWGFGPKSSRVVNAVNAGKKWWTTKRTVGHVPKKHLEATQAVNTKTLRRKMKHLQPRMKNNHYPIRYSPLNTLSCWAARKAMCQIEHSSCDFIGFHHSSVQKVCCFLGSWICQDKTTLQSMRATTFNHTWEIKSGCKPLCVERTWPTLIVVSDLIWKTWDE